MHKDLRKIVKKLEDQDWIVEHRKGGHYMAWPPDKAKPPAVLAATPSDHRAWKNMIRDLRHSGARDL